MRSSTTFISVLESTLAMGNFLNWGGRLGSAVGFKFKALRKLADTKSLDGEHTLLGFLAMALLENGHPPAKTQLGCVLHGSMETTVDVRTADASAPLPVSAACRSCVWWYQWYSLSLSLRTGCMDGRERGCIGCRLVHIGCIHMDIFIFMYG